MRREMAKYKLGNQQFKTKKAIKEHIRSIVTKYSDNSILDDDDFDLMMDLLKLHPNSKQKIGMGVWIIKRIISREYKTPGFELVRFDGTSTDFSWRQCLEPSNHKADVKKACREVIKQQIMEFRNGFMSNGIRVFVCPITKIETPVSELHVDHKPPFTFATIFDDWVLANEIDINKIKLKGYGDNNETLEFADSGIADNFAQFHLTFAELRMVSAEGNYQAEREYRKTKQRIAQ